jgi:diadenylate cyclase
LVRGPRAWRITSAIIIFVVLLTISRIAGLYEMNWILDKAALLAPVALVILLLPELRQGLEGLGKLGAEALPLQRLGRNDSRTEVRTIEEIVAAVAELAAAKVGALIVIERTNTLDEIAANGVMLNATVSAPLLVSIFYEGNPLHDGAVIIRREKILSGACRLPLSESVRLAKNVHMRHRAAVGITEATDAIAVIVSEERGTISYSMEGSLRFLATHLELREVLNKEIRVEEVLQRRRLRELARAKKDKVEAIVTPTAGGSE